MARASATAVGGPPAAHAPPPPPARPGSPRPDTPVAAAAGDGLAPLPGDDRFLADDELAAAEPLPGDIPMDTIYSVQKMADVLVAGPDAEREFILFEVQQLLDHCPGDTMCILLPVLCEHVPSWSLDLQMKAAHRLYDVVSLELDPQTLKLVAHAAFGIIESGIGQDSSAVANLFNLCGVILNDVLPDMEWTTAEVSAVMSVVDVHRAQPQSTSRKIAARVLGALATSFDVTKVERQVLPRLFELFDDRDVHVRGVVVESLAYVGAALPARVTETEVWPRVENLLDSDEDSGVKTTALRTMAHILQAQREKGASGRLFREQLPPVFNRITAFARRHAPEDQRLVDDATYTLLEVVSEVFGQFVYSLSLFGRRSFLKDAYKAYSVMATCNGPLIRRACAFNMPGVAKALGERFAMELSGLCEFLARDTNDDVRLIIAAGIHESASLLCASPRGSHDRLFTAVCSLLEDENPRVRMNALEHFHELLTAFVRDYTDLASIRRLTPVFANLSVLSVGDWRIQKRLAEQLDKCVEIIPPDALISNVLPLLYDLANKGAPLVRHAAMNAIAHALRNIPSIPERNASVTRFWSEARTGPFWMRIAMLDGGAAALRIFSSQRFAELFAPTLLQLAHDPVANVRIRLAGLLPQMAPACSQSTLYLESVDRLRRDADPDVSMIMQTFDRDVAQANVRARANSSTDTQKFREEQEVYGFLPRVTKRVRGRLNTKRTGRMLSNHRRQASDLAEQSSGHLSVSPQVISQAKTPLHSAPVQSHHVSSPHMGGTPHLDAGSQPASGSSSKSIVPPAAPIISSDALLSGPHRDSVPNGPSMNGNGPSAQSVREESSPLQRLRLMEDDDTDNGWLAHSADRELALSQDASTQQLQRPPLPRPQQPRASSPLPPGMQANRTQRADSPVAEAAGKVHDATGRADGQYEDVALNGVTAVGSERQKTDGDDDVTMSQSVTSHQRPASPDMRPPSPGGRRSPGSSPMGKTLLSASELMDEESSVPSLGHDDERMLQSGRTLSRDSGRSVSSESGQTVGGDVSGRSLSNAPSLPLSTSTVSDASEVVTSDAHVDSEEQRGRVTRGVEQFDEPKRRTVKSAPMASNAGSRKKKKSVGPALGPGPAAVGVAEAEPRLRKIRSRDDDQPASLGTMPGSRNWLSASGADVESQSISDLRLYSKSPGDGAPEDQDSKSLGQLSIARNGPATRGVATDASSSSRRPVKRATGGPPPMEGRAKSWGGRFVKSSRQSSASAASSASAGPESGSSSKQTSSFSSAAVKTLNGLPGRVTGRARSSMREASGTQNGKTASQQATPRKRRSKKGVPNGSAETPRAASSVTEAVFRLEKDGGVDDNARGVAGRVKSFDQSHRGSSSRRTESLPDGYDPGTIELNSVAVSKQLGPSDPMAARTMSVDERSLSKRHLAYELGVGEPDCRYNGVPVAFDSQTGLPTFRGIAPWTRSIGTGQVRHPDGKEMPLSALAAPSTSRSRPGRSPRAHTSITSFHSDGAHAFASQQPVHPSMMTSSVTTSSQPVPNNNSNGFLKTLFGRRSKR